jgi:predicted benzoate:H+ symporter BenE
MLREVVRGPLVLGPLLTFSVSLSHITVLGLGPLFWALVLGTAVSLLLEGEQTRAWRSTRADE